MRGLAFSLLIIIAFCSCNNTAQTLQTNSASGMVKKTIVLVHGYTSDSRDMRNMAKFLEAAGYKTVTVDLPLTFDHVEEAAKLFAAQVDRILSDIPADQSIAMVGHSTGGLVIRYFLSHYPHHDRVGHAVLIATPNRGSTLAGMAGEISELLVETLATLDSLRPENISKLGLKDPKDTKIGAIAGNKDNLVLGQLLEKENDGRVEVDSVYYPELVDFIVVPFNHHEIHHKEKTARLVISFIETGSFEHLR